MEVTDYVQLWAVKLSERAITRKINYIVITYWLIYAIYAYCVCS